MTGEKRNDTQTIKQVSSPRRPLWENTCPASPRQSRSIGRLVLSIDRSCDSQGRLSSYRNVGVSIPRLRQVSETSRRVESERLTSRDTPWSAQPCCMCEYVGESAIEANTSVQSALCRQMASESRRCEFQQLSFFSPSLSLFPHSLAHTYV